MSGDLVVVLDGSPLPFVLRKVDDVSFSLVGPGWFYEEGKARGRAVPRNQNIFDFNVWVYFIHDSPTRAKYLPLEEDGPDGIDRFQEICNDHKKPKDYSKATYFTLA
jgi:hypothetical protein